MNNTITFVKSVFRGFGQIMLQDNYWTGILFFLGICYGSIRVGFIALLCSIIGILTAKAMKCDKESIEKGLYGFNAILVGVGLSFYFQLNVWSILAIIIGSVLSTILMGIALRKRIPAFTFPFILTTWIFLFLLKNTGLAIPPVPNNFVDVKWLEDFWIEGHAFGEVIFQESVIVGLIFIIAVFINQPIAALYGIVASIVSAALSRHLNQSLELITAGIFSFNAILCGIGCSGNKVKDGVYVLLAVILSTVVDIWMMGIGWTPLTFPFVFSMWVIFLIKKYISVIRCTTFI